jgi:pilus assembly protein Flp/PilA
MVTDPNDREGATAVEYALMVGLIAVVIVVAVGLVGDALINVFEGFLTAMGWS